jgi:hypothetical protein
VAQMQQLQTDFSCFADPSLKPGDGTITIGCGSSRCHSVSPQKPQPMRIMPGTHESQSLPHLALNGHVAVQTQIPPSSVLACMHAARYMHACRDLYARGDGPASVTRDHSDPAARRLTYFGC